MPKAFYHELSLDGRTGLHQRFSDETMALIPPDRHRYICAEDAQGAALQPAAM